MSLRLECLGGFALSRDGAPLQLSARKARVLLGLLAVARRRTLPRARLSALLWETSDADQARVSLRQAMAQVRRAAGEGWIDTDGDDLRLGPRVATDLDAFQAALTRNDPAEAARLYRGPFLDGLDMAMSDLGQAIAGERARLSNLASGALAHQLDRVEEGAEAAALAHRLLGLDPLNEMAHRRLMRIDAARGMKGAARARFEALETALRRDIGTMPEPETRALHERIRRGGGPAPRSENDPGQAMPAPPDPTCGFLLLGMADGGEHAGVVAEPGWAALHRTALAHGAQELDSGPGEVAYHFAGQALRDVSTLALQLADETANGGIGISFGLLETEGADAQAHIPTLVRARRLAAMADPGEVLIPGDLAARLGLAADPARRAVPLSAAAARGRPAPPIVGRDMELAQVDAAITAARAGGHGLVVHLSGEAGIGKSRLAAEIARRRAAQGTPVAQVGFEAFSPGGRHLAQRILACLPDVPSADPGATAVERAVWSWLVDPEIGTDAELRMSALDPDVQRRLTVEVLASVLNRAAAKDGLLLVIEDCHWSPIGAGDFILALLARLEDSRVDVLLTERPTPGSLDQRLATRARSGVMRIALPPLSRSAAQELVGAVAPDFARSGAAIDRAAGHPLFLIRLLEASWTEGALPGTVADLVREQIERLPAAERSSLRQAAILGAAFDPADVAAIFTESTPPRPNGDLLHATRTGLAFGHELVHRTIYESVPPDVRQHWHARAAAHFRGTDPILWADHALQAGDHADAAAAAAAAANAMFAGRRFAAAFPYIEAGLDRGGDPEATAELHSCRAGIRRVRGDMAGALDDYRAAHASATRAETRAAMLCRQALVLHRLGRGDDAERALDAAEEIADAIGLTGLGRAEIHEQRGNRAFVLGDHAACMAHHRAGLAAAEATGDPRGIARGHGGIGDAAYAAGRFHTAYRHFSRAIETAERGGLGLVREEYLFMRAFSLFYADPGPQAYLLIDIAVDSAMQCGAARTEMIARGVRAEMRTANGDLDGLEEDLQAIEALETAKGEDRFSKDVETLYAFLEMRRGQVEAARSRVARLLPGAGCDAYVGGTIFGLAALLARDRAERDRRITEGLACLDRGALSHAVIWFHASVLERAVLDADQDLARHHMDALERFAAQEPVGIVTLYLRTAELVLWPSTEAERREHAVIVEDAGLADCAQILMGRGTDLARA